MCQMVILRVHVVPFPEALMISKKSRRIDLASIALIVLGGLCYVASLMGMETLRTSQHDPAAPLFAGYVRYTRLLQLSYAGIAAIAIGIGVAIYAAIHARAARVPATPVAGD